MRLTTIGAALLVAGCAGTQTADNTQPVKRACGGVECFYEREVRDFEVINHTTLVVYVGPQRCPYQVELYGTFCDMAFAAELYFDSPTEPGRNSSPGQPKDTVIPANPARPGSNTPIDPRSPESRLSDLRICGNDITIGVSGGDFTSNPTNAQTQNNPIDNNQPSIARHNAQQSDCQIQSVSSLTDDKLIELYVRKGVVPPPPPVGSGQIQVGAQSAQQTGGAGNGAGAQQGEAQPATSGSQLSDASR